MCLTRQLEQIAQQPAGDGDDFPEAAHLGRNNKDTVWVALEKSFQDAERAGFNLKLLSRLRNLLYKNYQRMQVKNDGLADVEPLNVKIEDGAAPARCQQHRYLEQQSKFMAEYIVQRECGFVVNGDDGLVPQCRCATRALTTSTRSRATTAR